MKTLRFVGAVVLASALVASCSSAEYSGQTISSGLIPNENGFSFPNFGSSASPEIFDETDIIAMFGASECLDGVAEPCVLTAEAAAWARMVNETRSSGHCEGPGIQESPEHVLRDARDIVLVTVVGKTAAPCDGADGEHGAAAGRLEERHVGPHLR